MRPRTLLILCICFLLAIVIYITSSSSEPLIQQANHSHISVSWYTKLYDPPYHSGFIYETFSYLLPLSRLMQEIGWDAGIQVSQAFRNEFVRDLSGKDNIILRSLLLKETKRRVESDTSKFISVVFEQPRYYPQIFTNTSQKHSVYKIGRAMFETTWIPFPWKSDINTYLDELWVPSSFAREVFKAAGVTVPILVIHQGFKSEEFVDLLSPENLLETRKRLFPECEEEDLVFFSVGGFQQRKGHDILLDVFTRLPRTAAACLYLRTSDYHDTVEYRHFERKVTEYQKSGHRVFLSQHLPRKELVLAHKSADVFILLSHGEGWGRPIMESMAAAVPAIVPFWSGHTEFVQGAYSFPIQVDRTEQAFSASLWRLGPNEKEIQKHRWAHIDTNRALEKIFWCLNNRERLKEIGMKARSAMFRSFTEEIIARKVAERLRTIIYTLKH